MTIVKNECSECFNTFRLDTERLTVTMTVPSNGRAKSGWGPGGKHVPAHKVTVEGHRAMTPTQRLLTRLRAMGLDIPEGAVLRRTYAGYWQRNEGAWSWYLDAAVGVELGIGSQYPVTLLLRGRIMVVQHWNNRDFEVIPWEFISEAQRGDYRRLFEEPR